MQDLQVTYIGHATCLLRMGTCTVLTDPHFGRRVTPWSKRRSALPCDPGNLPTLDAVLISTAQFDHLHLGSFKYISGTVPVIVPPGTAMALHPFVQNPVIELAHWVPHKINDDVSVIAAPVRYVGGRIVPGARFRHASAYLLQWQGRTVYFAGCTSFGTHFREVGNIYGIDLALLPLDHHFSRMLTSNRPLLANHFIQACKDLGTKHALPICWGTFGHSRRSDTQAERLRQSTEDCQMHVIAPGHTFELPRT